jgi:phosphomevalonate kinase
MIIAISGKTGTGKTTLANHLAAMLPATVLSFATPLKDEVAERYLIDRASLDTQEGKTADVRFILQYHGQRRRDKSPGYWVRKMSEKIGQTSGHIIIDDMRYTDELAMVRCDDHPGHALRWAIRVSPYPGWEPGPHSTHQSETALDGLAGWDVVLNPLFGDMANQAARIVALLEELHRD